MTKWTASAPVGQPPTALRLVPDARLVVGVNVGVHVGVGTFRVALANLRDDLETRHVINRTCAELDKAFIFGAVNLFDGQVSVFQTSQGPCLACVFPQIPQAEQEKSQQWLAVLNTLPAVVGALQAAEAIKVITGLGKPLIGKLLIYNTLNTTFEQVSIKKNPACPVYGN